MGISALGTAKLLALGCWWGSAMAAVCPLFLSVVIIQKLLSFSSIWKIAPWMLPFLAAFACTRGQGSNCRPLAERES